MAPYKKDYPVGTRVRIIDPDALSDFQRTWKFHNNLTVQQLAYAGQVAEVEKVSFYHGGDVLYQLVGLPLLWHEPCLLPAEQG
jgi:hypothetical protein